MTPLTPFNKTLLIAIIIAIILGFLKVFFYKKNYSISHKSIFKK